MRSLSLVSAVLAVVAIACGGDTEDPGATTADVVTTRALAEQSSASLDLEEVSGLGARTLDGKTSFLAVGDRTHDLLTFDLAGGKPRETKRHDLSRLFSGGKDPQWEGVAGDASGRVFILDEKGAIHVIDRKLERLLHTMRIEIPRSHPLGPSWASDDNSRAEGLLLLRNGHVLVAKEKGPAAILELAPEGARAEGYRADLALGDHTFELPAGAESTLVPVASWGLKSSATRLVGDISELALDRENRLLLLSDQSRVIAQVERELRPDEGKIDVKTIFELPRSVEKAEGLILSGGTPLVAIDHDSGKASFFQLEALP